ncbi:MAG: hypothetical protein WBA57_09050 [Elainellaceae cyanobacterium]
MSQPPDSNGSNGSHKAYETNGSKGGHDKRLPRDRPYVPVAKPAPPEDAAHKLPADAPNRPIQSHIPDNVPELDAERARRARQTAKRFYLILLALGLAIGAVVSVAIVVLLNRFGLTEPPERPLLEQFQPDPVPSDSSFSPTPLQTINDGQISFAPHI